MSALVAVKREVVRRVAALTVLLACAGAAFAQAGPGGPPGGGPPTDRISAGEKSDRESTKPPPGMFDIPALPPNAPQPSPDPRNLDGVWYHEKPLDFSIDRDVYGYDVPYNALGRKVYGRRQDSLRKGTPFVNASAKCFPVGQPWQMDLNFPFHIFQFKDRIDILFEEYHGLVNIALNAAKAPPPGYMGRSIGHWDGDTLVVETTGFKEPLWVSPTGSPASRNAKLTMRIRKVKTDHWFLDVLFTLDDPTYYTRSWSWTRDYSWRPDMALFREYNCENQTGVKDGLDPSLIPEPQD